ncbi:hypothetical protein B0A48_04813 [Cryoendolithus antarcticus]|uniref:Dicer-like protein 1 n=1 Tax=Cryoendolithus antarcticus TaxID=1507870 RepID=A0A1V8TDG5_9PEZI|nr:hypothetical protein B0A48_04813 [Cryoendolithus antarcticus]
MTKEELPPLAEDDGVLLDVHDLQLEDDEKTALSPGPPSTQAQKRKVQKEIFEAWLQSDVAREAMASKRKVPKDATSDKTGVDVEDDRLDMKALFAKQQSANIISTKRDYQEELFERAKEQNTIAVLDTGSGKTLIAVLLLQWVLDNELESRAKGGQPKTAFFLVASVTLVFQQHAVLEKNLDHKVARFCGSMNVDTWSKEVWDKHLSENTVIVCTADILLQCLSHSYTTMQQINLLIFDEAHHTKKNHAYAKIIKDYYIPDSNTSTRPRIFGMTASPIDSKGDVVQAAQELETLLHSRILTSAKARRSEHQMRQDEKILLYASLRPPFETNFVGNVRSRFGHISVLAKVYSIAQLVASELGDWCADQYLLRAFTEKRVNRYKRGIEQVHNARTVNAPIDALDAAVADIQAASKYVIGRAEHMQLDVLKNMHLSSKVQALRSHLAQVYERQTESKSLIFVNTRYTARLMSMLFKQLGMPHLRCGFLTGEGGSTLDDETFSFRRQVVTLNDFRTGKLNCLFVTSVAEEGLDVPDCNLVVRFDLYNTMVQYIQSRGRARKNPSKFIHMLEVDNSIHTRMCQGVRQQELAMRNFCETLPEDRQLVGNEDLNQALLAREEIMQSWTEQTTGAKLTYGNALVYLANFVSCMPTDSDEPQHPTFAVTSVGSKFVAEVLLPDKAPIRSAVGREHTKKTLAKRSAAFEACKTLREKKYLGEYLMPTYVKKLPAMRNALLAVNMKKTLQYDMRTKPDVWQQSRGSLPTELFMMIVEYSNGLGRPHQPLVMLTRKPVPVMPSFALYLNDGTEVSVVPRICMNALKLDSGDLEKLTAFTLRVFSDCFSKKYENDAKQLSYWLAPAASGIPCPARVALDWTLLDEVAAREEYAWTTDMPDEFLSDRFFVDKWDGGRKFFVKGVDKTRKALDPVPLGSPKPKGTSKVWKYMQQNILEYSNSMFVKSRERNQHLWDVEQPVVEAETVLLRRNMLAAPTEKEMKTPSKAWVCPQPLIVSVLPPRIAVTCLTWPAIIWKIESVMIAVDAAKLIGIDCEPETALAAVTKDSDNSGEHDSVERINFQYGMGSNYERLEFMGDCFLKTATTISTFIQNPNDNEFEFHVRRMLMLCNKNLLTVARDLKLYEYIRSQAFSRRMWYPEGMKLLEGKGAKQTEEIEAEVHNSSKHNLGEKTIADVCEALIGAAFMTHNKPGEWHPDQWENAIRAVTKLVKSDDHKMLQWSDYKVAYAIPAYQIGEATASQLDMAAKIELEHPYHFKHPRLLRSAFLHPSQPYMFEKLPNYQRLEFLGDALLDQASITHIFYKFPDKDPQWLTEHKMAMIGNKALGMIAVETGFYKHLRHHHDQIQHQIQDYATELLEAKSISNGAKDYWIGVSDPPKCLGDIVEAYVGAMFIDSDFDYSTVETFFNMHIQPWFDDMSLYDTYANNHPCTHLHNVLRQSFGCMEYRMFKKEVPATNNSESKDVMHAVMIHLEIVTWDKSTSSRYGQIRAAKAALDMLQGLTPMEFRQRFGCNCVLKEGDEKAGVVQADCAI